MVVGSITDLCAVSSQTLRGIFEEQNQQLKHHNEQMKEELDNIK